VCVNSLPFFCLKNNFYSVALTENPPKNPKVLFPKKIFQENPDSLKKSQNFGIRQRVGIENGDHSIIHLT
jgi:hypothetical protein